MHKIEFLLFLEVCSIVYFFVLKGQVSSCKDGRTGMTFMMSYFTRKHRLTLIK